MALGSLRRALVETNEDLVERLDQAWKRSDAIFSLVRPEALAARPIELRHPFVFYVGHLAAFAWNMLGKGVLGRESPRPEFDRLFDFGIDPDDDHAPAESEWPPLAEIVEYRDRVRDLVRASTADVARVAGLHPLAERGRIYHLVLEHELMHHETLCYMLQELERARKLEPDWWMEPRTGSAPADRRTVLVPAGTVSLGADPDALPFAWDNELPLRRVEVEAFAIDSHPVTIGDYLAFVDEGGYESEELWDEKGWSWVGKHGRAHPKDWRRTRDGFVVRTMFAELPLAQAAAWPVSVSWGEAAAYARFRGGRLPEEAELRRAAHGTPGGEESLYPWGDAPPDRSRGSFDFHDHGPVPVGSRGAGRSAFGVDELVGNGWEWTATVFAAHPGFESTIADYPGYSRNFFDGDHRVIFGGSWATDARLLRRSFRNWYRYNYPFPFTKFRVARDA